MFSEYSCFWILETLLSRLMYNTFVSYKNLILTVIISWFYGLRFSNTIYKINHKSSVWSSSASSKYNRAHIGIAKLSQYLNHNYMLRIVWGHSSTLFPWIYQQLSDSSD